METWVGVRGGDPCTSARVKSHVNPAPATYPHHRYTHTLIHTFPGWNFPIVPSNSKSIISFVFLFPHIPRPHNLLGNWIAFSSHPPATSLQYLLVQPWNKCSPKQTIAPGDHVTCAHLVFLQAVPWVSLSHGSTRLAWWKKPAVARLAVPVSGDDPYWWVLMDMAGETGTTDKDEQDGF